MEEIILPFSIMKIENEYLSVSVTSKGGSLTSIFDKKRNVELLYQPLPNSWQGQDVFIFPFVARLRDGTYTLNGKEYSMKNHGVIRYMVGQENASKNKLVVTFNETEESLKAYPFKFTAISEYELKDKTLTITYKIFNNDSKDLSFMIGGHPAFKVPGILKDDEFDIRGNVIKLPKELNLNRIDMDETYSFVKGEVGYKITNEISLDKALFREHPTLILNAKDFNYVDLVKSDGSILRVTKNSINYLALWSDAKYGDYVAVEPWQGLPDYLSSDKELKNKPNMMFLAPKNSYSFSYSIEVIK